MRRNPTPALPEGEGVKTGFSLPIGEGQREGFLLIFNTSKN